MKERYVIGKDFNTKDWFVYDNETDKYICFCDTEEEAEKYVTKICKEMIMNILDEDMDKRESEAIKTGNGECEYFILPGLCGFQSGECGGYEDCDEVKCPKKKNRLKSKEIRVTMTVVLKDDADISEIKKWEHHVDYAIDMDSYPEIDHIENVKVEEQ